MFIRLGLVHPARVTGLYVILMAFKCHLKEDVHLIKEVQETKSGFAFCAGSIKALKSLEKYTIDIINLIADYKIKK